MKRSRSLPSGTLFFLALVPLALVLLVASDEHPTAKEEPAAPRPAKRRSLWTAGPEERPGGRIAALVRRLELSEDEPGYGPQAVETGRELCELVERRLEEADWEDSPGIRRLAEKEAAAVVDCWLEFRGLAEDERLVEAGSVFAIGADEDALYYAEGVLVDVVAEISPRTGAMVLSRRSYSILLDGFGLPVVENTFPPSRYSARRSEEEGAR